MNKQEAYYDSAKVVILGKRKQSQREGTKLRDNVLLYQYMSKETSSLMADMHKAIVDPLRADQKSLTDAVKKIKGELPSQAFTAFTAEFKYFVEAYGASSKLSAKLSEMIK
jgi:hypothetical protein